MNLNHLNSDQRQYFWMSLGFAGLFIYLATKTGGSYLALSLFMAVAEAGCAVAIFRQWRIAPWFYLFGCVCLMVWAGMRMYTRGYSHFSAIMLAGGLLSATGTYWLRKAMEEDEDKADEESRSDLFELPKEEQEKHVDDLVEAYAKAFGDPRWVHHVVPKAIWLHKYAEFIVTIPPTDARPTWLYGTLLVSALSESRVELILERPKEDTIGAIGTLSRLIQYFIESAPLEEWNTMGKHPFFGEESTVRGLLFCPPPDSLSDSLQIPSGDICLRYVAGITEEQLETAQKLDREWGGSQGAMSLFDELKISETGIAELPN